MSGQLQIPSAFISREGDPRSQWLKTWMVLRCDCEEKNSLQPCWKSDIGHLLHTIKLPHCNCLICIWQVPGMNSSWG